VLPVLDEPQAQKEARSAHVADGLVALGRHLEAVDQFLTDVKDVLLQVLLLKHVEDRKARGTGHRVAAGNESPLVLKWE
jgi:hypothetical protein